MIFFIIALFSFTLISALNVIIFFLLLFWREVFYCSFSNFFTWFSSSLTIYEFVIFLIYFFSIVIRRVTFFRKIFQESILKTKFFQKFQCLRIIIFYPTYKWLFVSFHSCCSPVSWLLMSLWPAWYFLSFFIWHNSFLLPPLKDSLFITRLSTFTIIEVALVVVFLYLLSCFNLPPGLS